jgi:predicted HTH domain antitoxin
MKLVQTEPSYRRHPSSDLFMSLKLSIPNSVLQAIRLPEQRIEQELLHELAIALYSQDLLSFGKARELAQMDKYEFGQLLSQRGVLRHYTAEELDDDLTYARNQ